MVSNGAELAAFFDRLRFGRTNHNHYWELIQRYLMPESHGFWNKNSDGTMDRNQIFDGTAERASDDLSSGIASMLVNPQRHWFALAAPGKGLENDDEIKRHLQDAREKIHDMLSMSKSNFFKTLSKVCDNLAPLGQAYSTMMVDKDLKIVRFASIPVQQVYVKRNDFEELEMYFRCIPMTASQILKEYKGAYGNQSTKEHYEELKKKAKMHPNEEIEVVHCIFEREADLVTGLTPDTKKYASVYLWYDKKIILKEAGFDRFPICAPAWRMRTGEDYGVGPGHRSIPEIIVLNAMVRDNLAASQSMITPPMMAPFGTVVDDELNLSARAMNWIQENMASMVQGFNKPEALHVVANMPVALEQEDRRRDGIRMAFFADLLMELKNAEMSATESSQNLQSRIAKLTNPFLRIIDDFIALAIDYSYESLVELGEIEVPTRLKGKKLKVTFTTALTDAFNLAKLAMIERAISSLANMKGLPEPVLVGLELPELSKQIFYNSGADLKVLKKEEEAKKAVAQQQETQQVGLDAQSLASAGSGLKDLSSAFSNTRGL